MNLEVVVQVSQSSGYSFTLKSHIFDMKKNNNFLRQAKSFFVNHSYEVLLLIVLFVVFI